MSMKRTKDLKFRLLNCAGLIMMMCFLFMHFSITSLAAEGKVKAASAKIRKEATTSSEMLGSAAYGEKYNITGEVTGADGYVWYQITFGDNQTGYVRSDLMDKSGEVESTDTTTATTDGVTELQPISATITGNTVRVRSGASTDSSIVTNVLKDVVVTVTGKATDGQGKTWYRVTFSSDSGEVTGFIREDFLSVSGTVTPIVDDPVVEEPTTEEPVEEDTETTTPVKKSDYELVEEGDVWWLVDNAVTGYKYDAAGLISAIKENEVLVTDYQSKVKSQKTWIIFLVILVVALGVLATLLFLKVKEVMDEAYFAAVEKETIRQRQGQKANNSSAGSSSKNKNVMHTVGADKNAINKQSMPKGNNIPKPGTNTATKTVQQKPAGTVPQTVKVSNPSETRDVRPANTTAAQKTTNAAGAQKTTNAAGVQKTTNTVGAQKTASAAGVQKTASTAGTTAAPKAAASSASQPKQAPQKAVENTSKKSWQSKNFMAEDDDDDFEFEFLNWDGSDDN